MSKSTFIAIESVDGVVQRIEGSLEDDRGLMDEVFDALFSSGPVNWRGKRLNDLLNYCARLGYEHFDTDTIGSRKIHRLKLKTPAGK